MNHDLKIMGSKDSFIYDVYLSFRGEDTRCGFMGHLYTALNQRGIHTFIDDLMLVREEEISSPLLNAIKESRVAIIIFSKNYASSTWCLNELANILDCYEKNKTGRLVLPVFYDVDRSDARNGRGSYGEALAKHEKRFNHDKDRVNKWRNSLRKAANLSGFDSRKGGYEYKLIESIVKEVCRKVSPVSLSVADYRVGLESRVYKVISLLNLESHDVVLMVGIHGMGGIGKTTIAREVYNSISDKFEGLCFLDDVRQNSIKHLQETMLYKIYDNGDINIQNAKEGILMTRERLYQKRVLLVLDDVDKMEQLQATIAGASDWFGPGSRVIITTRDKHLLASHAVERTYEVEELSEKEALDLFCWSAFKTNKVDPCYADISKQALDFASGNPLALHKVGLLLYDKGISAFSSVLARGEGFSTDIIQTVLKISYDSLEEEEKRIFLDIACFFNGHKLEGVKDILSALYGASVKYSIKELIEKSLIKIDDGFVTLHNLIQVMGRDIVQQESPYEPGKRSRLWFAPDVVQVLEENSGSSTIESLFLDFPKDEVNPNGSKSKEVYWDGDALKKMEKLRVLVIKSGCFNKGPTHLPNSLKVLKWRGYPSSSLPNDFHPKELAILELPASRMAVTEPIQWFISLKVLNFSNCEWVTHIPDVSGLPNLEKLSIRDCMNLSKIHESVGFLDKLTILDVCHCKKLMTLPPIILTSLEQLNISHCPALKSFPEILGKMENLTELRIIESPIKHLPFSIQNLNGLQKLELQNCGMVQLPSSIAMLSQLYLMCVSRCEGLWLSKQDVGEEWETKSSKTEHLMMSYCNLSDDFLPIGVTWFPNVQDLDLSGSNFTILHACIKECYSLRNLKLDDCVYIQEITVLPLKLETFSAKRCKSLEYMVIAEECRSLRELILDDCIYLREIKGILQNLDHFSAKNCTLLTSQCASISVNQIMTTGPQEDQTVALSHKLTSTQSPSPFSEAETCLVPQPTFQVKMPLGDVGRETSESLSDNEVYAPLIQNDPPVIQRCSACDKNAIKRVSLDMEAENSMKKELESEIATLRIQLSTKEPDSDQPETLHSASHPESEPPTIESDSDSDQLELIPPQTEPLNFYPAPESQTLPKRLFFEPSSPSYVDNFNYDFSLSIPSTSSNPPNFDHLIENVNRDLKRLYQMRNQFLLPTDVEKEVEDTAERMMINFNVLKEHVLKENKENFTKVSVQLAEASEKANMKLLTDKPFWPEPGEVVVSPEKVVEFELVETSDKCKGKEILFEKSIEDLFDESSDGSVHMLDNNEILSLKEELAAQKARQEALEAQVKDIAENQKQSLTKIDSLDANMKTLISLLQQQNLPKP